MPFIAGGVELVLLVDGETGLELTGLDVTLETNFSSASVATLAEAGSFASRVSFPSHGLIVIAAPHRTPEPARGMTKGIVDPAELDRTVEQAVRIHGRAWLETDMRAHLNPTRMRRLPCADCGAPRNKARAEVLACAGCGQREERPRGGPSHATAFDCPFCNPLNRLASRSSWND